MFFVTRYLVVLFCAATWCAAQTATVGLSDGDEFVGPFSSWTNVKTAYGAVGDGVTDDTLALQRALNNVATPGYSPVLYLPAGTYKITSTLGIATPRQGVSIIGQDPSVTTILWAGPSNQEMLYLNGFVYSKISRITWNGSGTAQTAIDYGWNGTGSFGGSTYVEDSDEVFENLVNGIRGGTLGYADSEHAILRCKFISNSRAGLSVEDYNALDWYVWDCTFINNYLGVTNLYGGGNFHIIGSFFQSSGRADIELGSTSYFSMRQNFSQNSNAFLIADATGSASSAITLQSNTILDSVASPLQINNPGTVLMFDNVIRGSSNQSGPLITVKDAFDVPTVPGGMVAIGNTVSQYNWYSVPNGGEVFDIANNISGRTAINPQTPIMPGALPNYNRRVFEVASGAGNAAIQQAIDNAIVYSGQRPVVHLPAGDYPITSSIVIPSGSDVQLVGDGGGPVGPSKLHWVASNSAPLLRLPGPIRAAFRDFNVFAGSSAIGILAQNADQPSGRIFMDQFAAQQLTQYGLFINGLDNTSVILHNGYIVSDNIGIQVTGGPIAATGQTVPARNDMFAGLTASNNLTYNLNNHGKLMSQDVWYEGGAAQLLNLYDSGTFTLHSAEIAAQASSHGGVAQNVPSFQLTNFNGSVSLLGAHLDTRNSIGVQGTATNTNMLALGVLGPADNSNFFVDATSPYAQVALIDSRQATATGSIAVGDQITGIYSPSSFITSMVAQTRTEQAAPLSVLPAGTTDARFYRVSVYGGGNGMEIDASGPGSVTGPNISSIAIGLNNSSTATISWTTDQVADTQVVYGTTAAYGSSSTLDPSFVNSHTAAIQGLFLGTIYHFAVKSRSLSGYVTTSADQTFTTPTVSTVATLVNSINPTTARNNFTGWLGMKFTVGSAVPTISSLGRMTLSGNSGTHIVKLVRASDGSDVQGGSVTISMAGSTPGTFRYGSLSSSISLAANTAYYLVSSEVNGGDQWYDVSSIAGWTGATIQGAIFTDSANNYVLGASGSLSYGPLDFTYQVSASGGATPPSGSALLSGFQTGALRNNYSGYVGMDIAVGSSSISVTALGRYYLPGNSGTHLLKLVNASTWVDIPGGSVTLSLTSGATGQFAYANLASPILLAANSQYYLVSQEVAGGDQWYDATPVTSTNLVYIAGPVYFDGHSYSVVSNLPTQAYVPLNLLYSTLTSAAPTVAITSPAAGTVFSTPSINISASASASSGLTITGVQFQVDQTNIGSVQTSPPYAQVLSSSILATGTHWLTAVATDSTGNTTTSAAVQIAVTSAVSSTATGSPLITGFTSSTLRNNFSGYVGTQFAVGSSAMKVYALGRIYVSGNSGQHVVKLVNASTGADVAGTAVTIPVYLGTPGQFTYFALPSPVTLAPYNSYYLVSQESAGGDQWSDTLPVTSSAAASILAPVYSSGSSYFAVTGLANNSFVPVSLLYTQ